MSVTARAQRDDGDSWRGRWTAGSERCGSGYEQRARGRRRGGRGAGGESRTGSEGRHRGAGRVTERADGETAALSHFLSRPARVKLPRDELPVHGPTSPSRAATSSRSPRPTLQCVSSASGKTISRLLLPTHLSYAISTPPSSIPQMFPRHR